MQKGAKLYLAAACLAAIAASGCASLKRFAPPGIIKYEHIAGKKTQNPAIKARIAEAQKTGGASFPDLSAEPSKAPAGMPAAQQEALAASLRAGRNALEGDIAAARAAAAADGDGQVALPGATDQQGSLEEARGALDEAVKKDEAAARKERGVKPPPRRQN